MRSVVATTRTKQGKPTASGSPTKKPVRPAADVELNEQFHALLRDAAEKREERALTQAVENAAAARRESASSVPSTLSPVRVRAL